MASLVDAEYDGRGPVPEGTSAILDHLSVVLLALVLLQVAGTLPLQLLGAVLRVVELRVIL